MERNPGTTTSLATTRTLTDQTLLATKRDTLVRSNRPPARPEAATAEIPRRRETPASSTRALAPSNQDEDVPSQRTGQVIHVNGTGAQRLNDMAWIWELLHVTEHNILVSIP